VQKVRSEIEVRRIAAPAPQLVPEPPPHLLPPTMRQRSRRALGSSR
jgi:hypothetical protein